MRVVGVIPPSGFALWTSRLAIFCVILILSAAALHRLFALPTPVATNLVLLALIGAGAALCLAAAASVGIWRTGRAGTSRVVVGTIVSIGILLLPVGLWLAFGDLPRIYDVTTDPQSPPEFVTIATLRPPGANPVAYRGQDFYEAQRAAYPDLTPIIVGRPKADMFEIVSEVVRRMKMTIVREVPPGEGSGTGVIEAVGRTLIFGFTNDVVLRVVGDDEQSRVDIRSASRYGRLDFGMNADLVRTILKEIVAQLEATLPSAESVKAARMKARAERIKAAKERNQGATGRRSPKRRAQ
jgi:uncharacterized protein (DUF1499 family)